MSQRIPIFKGKIIEVDLETVVMPNDRRAELEIVRHPGGAAVVAIDEQRRVCLLRQWRYVAGGWLWELPAGKIDGGEPPDETAKRELKEEAGVVARAWTSLGPIVSSPGVFSEIVHLFLARDLAIGMTAHEQHELIELHWLPFAQALAWARSGEIRDAKTLIGLFRAETFLHPPA